MKKKFNDGWKFWKSEYGTAYEDALEHIGEFEAVAIPHDWLIGDAHRFYEDNTGWYFKKFMISKLCARTFIIFDGIYMDSTVYVNNKCAGEWKYGYSQFVLDITDCAVEGENTVFVRVNYKCPNSRWYSGAGIYRDIWLSTCNEQYIPENGIYVHTEKAADGYRLFVDTKICGLEAGSDAAITLCLTDADDREVTLESKEESRDKGHIVSRFSVKDISEWSPDTPHLYTLKATLLLKDKAVQTKNVKIGFRDIVLSPNEGIVLNGKRIKLNGVCIHHDLGALGAAYNGSAMKRRLRQLKSMGVNAIRLSHNMYAPHAIELMDEMGFLVISEAFDMWEKPKTEYDYARFFVEWHEKDVSSWIKRDRNHPCVFLWSIGNEIYDTHADERGQKITSSLKELVGKYDFWGNARATFGSNYMPWENAQKCADILKVVGYNYAENYYEAHHIEHPDWVIYGSETYSIVQSRGIYHFPLSESVLADDDLQCSSLGNSTTSWGAASIEECICKDRDIGFSMGQFLWTGYDYIGEPTPYHTKNSYFGLIDTAGFYKDAFYIWKSAWTSYKKDPFVHIFPYWDFNEGQNIDVRVVSNAPFVELFLNGESLGRQRLTHEPCSGYHVIADYSVVYKKGALRAAAYDEDGTVVAVAEKKSFSDTKAYRVSIDSADCDSEEDLVFAEITAVDKDGNEVENATDRVRVSVTQGELIGLDNGDSSDYDSYRSDTRKLFSGKLLAIIKPTGKKEDVCVKVQKIEDNVPVRSIKLHAEGKRELSLDNQVVSVRAEVLPEDATDKRITFRLLNEKGTESSLAKIDAAGDTAVVTGMFDGKLILRCESRDENNVVNVISTLDFTVSGMGTAYLDPFGFIPGNAYTDYTGRVSSGNEHGVATDREKETVVIYEGINFGDDGADEITVPIFALSDDEYPLQIWSGKPQEAGAELLADVVYQKKSIWNVYQEDTWKLNRRLTGIRTVSIVAHGKIHIKGFSFKKHSRAFERNMAADAKTIYGDSFEKNGQCVEKIGNNVTLAFGEMDFGEKGAEKICIEGRARGSSNTLQLSMKNKDSKEQVKEVLEFEEGADYISREFLIKPVAGRWEVEFIFLPGSNFDFRSFRFYQVLSAPVR